MRGWQRVMRISSVAAVVLMAAMSAKGAGTSQEGIVLFTPPGGWSRIADAGGVRYQSADKTVTFAVGASQGFEGSLEKVMLGVLEKAKALPQYREEARQPQARHNASSGVWMGVLYTYADTQRQVFKYEWVAVIGAGGRCVPITVTFADKKAYDAHAAAVAKFANDASLTTTVTLAAGKPPLTRYVADEMVDFLEWLMKAPMTDAQKKTVEAELMGYWKADNRSEIEGIVELMEAREQVAALPEAQRDLLREAIAEAAVEEWRKDTVSPSSRMMIEIYDAAHKPIAKGANGLALTRQAADAFTEYLFFAAGQAVGSTATPTAELKKQFAEQIAKDYAGLGKEQQELIANMPLVWAALRVAWPDMAAEQKKRYVDAWNKDESIAKLGAALKPAEPAVATAGTGAAAANSANDFMRQQMQLQMQQRQFQMMQQIMQSNHDTQRMIISNLGGNTSYSYQWR